MPRSDHHEDGPLATVVVGIETEYGVVVRGPGGGIDAEANPTNASAALVSSYVAAVTEAGHGVGRPHRVGWDFGDESPGNDARGEGPNPYAYAPEIETHMVNAVLTNGSRYYVDHAHPELSTPECRDARSAVVYDRAGERILVESMRLSEGLLGDGRSIVVYKNNSDGKGQSYGCHENYLLSRSLPFSTLVRHATPHLVTRQIFCGAGKVGSEVPGRRDDRNGFQISQRADFFEEHVGLETTIKRPIINTRDEPHADPRRYRRFHVIVGDANMSELATYLKVGTTALWLSAVQHGFGGDAIDPTAPVAALRTVSGDLSLAAVLTLADGSSMTALELQWELLSRSRRWLDDGAGLDNGPRRCTSTWRHDGRRPSRPSNGIRWSSPTESTGWRSTG
ncbi:MAG: proteasome accessory factor PafA2 family protein [Microthrixaceae bacterium]